MELQNNTLENVQTEKKLEGIGGWLILVAVGFILGIPLTMKLIYDLIVGIQSGNYGSQVFLKAIVYGELIFNCLFLVMTIILLVLFFKKKKLFIKAWMYVLIILFIFTILDESAVYFFVNGVDLGFPFMTSFFSGIRLIIWGLYLKKSVRVKNTFVY